MRSARWVIAVAFAGSLLGARSGEAQTGYRLGVFGGLDIATVGGRGADDLQGKESRLGIHGGVSGEVGLSRRISLAVEAYYAMKGVKASSTGQQFTIALDYIELPLLLKASLGSGSIRPYVFAGPALSIQARCKVSGTVGSGVATLDCDDPSLNIQLRGTDFSVLGGAGIRLGRVFVAARYDLGLTNLNKSTGGDSEPAHNRAFLLSVGAVFPIRQ